MEYRIVKNEEHNGLEIYFDEKPSEVNLPENAKEFDARLYDRDCGAGAARAAIERYKKLGFF